MPSNRTTRETLINALEACIESAPSDKRADLAVALEKFAETRGKAQFERVTRVPILADIFAAIEEATEAMLFYGEE